MTKEELLAKIDEKIESVESVSLITATPWRILRAVSEWAIEKNNMEFELYDDISYGEVIAAEQVYQILKKELS